MCTSVYVLAFIFLFREFYLFDVGVLCLDLGGMTIRITGEFLNYFLELPVKNNGKLW